MCSKLDDFRKIGMKKRRENGVFGTFRKSSAELIGISGVAAKNTVKNMAHTGALARGLFWRNFFLHKIL